MSYQLHMMSTMYLPHIYNMVDSYLRLPGFVRIQVVQEQLIITDHYKLALPAFPYSSWFRYLLEKVQIKLVPLDAEMLQMRYLEKNIQWLNDLPVQTLRKLFPLPEKDLYL